MKQKSKARTKKVFSKTNLLRVFVGLPPDRVGHRQECDWRLFYGLRSTSPDFPSYWVVGPPCTGYGRSSDHIIFFKDEELWVGTEPGDVLAAKWISRKVLWINPAAEHIGSSLDVDRLLHARGDGGYTVVKTLLPPHHGNHGRNVEWLASKLIDPRIKNCRAGSAGWLKGDWNERKRALQDYSDMYGVEPSSDLKDEIKEFGNLLAHKQVLATMEK